MTVRGMVKGNIIILDEGAKLPDGARVEVQAIETSLSERELQSRREAVERIKANQILRYVGIDEITAEEKRGRAYNVLAKSNFTTTYVLRFGAGKHGREGTWLRGH